MRDTLTPLVFAIAAWWFATGAVFLAARYAPRKPGLIVGIATGAALMACYWLYVSARMDSANGIYIAFVSAIGLWGWNELTFLTGTVTGPRKSQCPPDLTGQARFHAAWQAVRDHELAILASAAIAAALTIGGENLIGLWTFLVLWGMRISAKLNIFYGAPFAINDLIPQHLKYLTSYFRTDRITGLFWISFLLGGILVGALGHAAITASDPLVRIGCSLVGAFALLGAVEHVFLITSVRDSALWTWAVDGRTTPSATIHLSRAAGELGAADNGQVIEKRRFNVAADCDVHSPSTPESVSLDLTHRKNLEGAPMRRSQFGSDVSICRRSGLHAKAGWREPTNPVGRKQAL